MTVHRPASSKPGGGRSRGGGGRGASDNDEKTFLKKKRREPPSTYRTYRAASDDPENTATTTSTRLCIKNIPPSFTSRQLRDYIIREYRQRFRGEKELVITDCHVLMHSQNGKAKLKGKSRRIAFVGFQSSRMATNVKEKFHQTFAQTSKLIVEYARTYQPPQKTNKEENKNDKKKGKELEQEKETKKSLLKTTKTATTTTTTNTNTKFWSNDLDLPVISSKNQKEEEEDVVQKEDKSEKAKYDDDDDDDDDKSTASSSSSSSDSSDDEADPLRSTTTKESKKKGGGMSDLDFLKSKQKMVDHLNDEEEEEDNDNNVSAEGKEGEASSSSSSDTDTDTDTDDDDQSSSPASDAQELPSQQEQKENPQEQQERPIDDKAEDDIDNDMDDDEPITTTLDQNRLFVRNIPFATTEQELQDCFAQHGPIQECHIPVDDQKTSKGFGYVSYENPRDAAEALHEMDGTDFQGRFLHVMLSRKQPQQSQQDQLRDNGDGGTNPPRALSYKERQELIRRKKETTGSGANKGWSASFVRGDAVVDSLADRLGIKKGDILNVKEGLSSGDAAVRLALGETQIIEENRVYFQDHGIDMEALVSFSTSKSNDNDTATIKRSATSLLVKNLPYDTQVEELNKIFHGASGSGSGPKRILLPPSRTIALVEYGHGSDAKRAFRKLAYRRFKSVPLYLEWAPMQAIMSESSSSEGATNDETEATPVKQKESAEDEQPTTNEDEHPALEGPTPSVYVKNLNFATTEDKLQKFFEDAVGDVRAVTIPKKVAPVKKKAAGGGSNDDDETMMQSLSMGFGFVEFASQDAARKAISKLQGKLVDGHALELKPSTKSITDQRQPVKTSKKNPTKITVRNVPFQASRTEILKLFGSFGQLKRVRLPKKFNGGHRGFAFVEFVTHKEALAAMKALSRTHLYGRHLVLEWAQDDRTDSIAGGGGGGNTVGAESMVALREKAQRDVLAAASTSGGSDSRQANKRQKLR